MSRKYKVDELLAELTSDDPAARAEYDALVRQPAATIDDLLAWFEGRGCRISRGAVWKHRRHTDELLEGVRRSAEMARAFADVAREGGIESLGEASLARFQQLMTEKLLSMDCSDEGDGLDAKELAMLSSAMNSAANTRQRIESVKAEYERHQREAVEQARAAADGGAAPGAVVETIKRALGLSKEGTEGARDRGTKGVDSIKEPTKAA